MKKDWFEIFKAGTHTDSKGTVRTYTEEDLDNIVSKYNPAVSTAPIVIGHPTTNAPAWGWIKAVKRDGDTLLALPSEVVSEFEEMFDKGMYKKRSISLYPDGSLRHVGFLGAVPPAVKGLKDIEFKDAQEDVTFDFSENWRINTIGRIFQRFREFIIEKYGTDEAEKIVGQYEIDELKEYIPDAEPAKTESFSEDNSKNNPKEDPMDAKLQKELDDLKTQVQNFQAQLTAKDTEIVTLKTANTALQTTIAETEKKGRTADFESFCEGLVKEGKLTPAQKPQILQQLEAAHQSGQEISFSEEGQEKKISAVDNLKNFFKTMPKIVNYQEFATRENAAGNPQGATAVDEGQSIADKVNKK